MYFQRKYLIEITVFMTCYEVASYAHVDWKYGHYKFTAYRDSGADTILERLPAKFYIFVMGSLNTVPERRNYAMPDTAACMKPHMSYDLVVYEAARKRAVETYETEMVPGHFAVAGINFAPMYNIPFVV